MDSLLFHPQNTLTIKSFNITQIALNIYILTANIFVLTQFLQQNARVILMVYYHLLLYYAVGNKSKLVVLTAAGCFGVLNVFRGALTFVGHCFCWALFLLILRVGGTKNSNVKVNEIYILCTINCEEIHKLKCSHQCHFRRRKHAFDSK